MFWNGRAGNRIYNQSYNQIDVLIQKKQSIFYYLELLFISLFWRGQDWWTLIGSFELCSLCNIYGGMWVLLSFQGNSIMDRNIKIQIQIMQESILKTLFSKTSCMFILIDSSHTTELVDTWPQLNDFLW